MSLWCLPALSSHCASSTWPDLPATTEVECGFDTPVRFGRPELAATERQRQLPSQRSEGGKKQALWERVGLWKRETAKHKMNHWKSNGRKARRWDLELRKRIQVGLVKWRTDMRLPVYLHLSLRPLLFSHQAPVWTHSCYWGSMTSINPLEWG